LAQPGWPKGIIGRSPAWKSVQAAVRRVAAYRRSVLVLGPSGTGKEATARAIHDLSPRRDGPFVPFDCVRATESLAEDELFGHERGA
jgi:two-component system NtrC family response regulator